MKFFNELCRLNSAVTVKDESTPKSHPKEHIPKSGLKVSKYFFKTAKMIIFRDV